MKEKIPREGSVRISVFEGLFRAESHFRRTDDPPRNRAQGSRQCQQVRLQIAKRDRTCRLSVSPVLSLLLHSSRRARMGSTLAARRAGAHPATTANTLSSTGTVI